MDILHRLEKLMDGFFAGVPRRAPHVSTLKQALIVAHRGAHGGDLQENTLAAFEHAFKLGCYGLELDIHATADDILVVNHDPTLKRLWNKDHTINLQLFSMLRDLIPALPSLDDVVRIYGKRMHLFIEIKAPFTAINTLQHVLQGLTPGNDYHLLCLDETVFPKLTMFPPASLLLVASHNNVNRFCDISLQESYGGVLGHYLLLTNRHVKKLREANQLVGVGFVDSKFSLYRELNRGLQLLFTNRARRIMPYL
jgi:glycerophosphoryl diester phosphodiesterase